MSKRNVNPVERTAATFHGLPAWRQGVPDWLIRHAARRAPPDLCERLEEEWCADLTDRSSMWARWRFAIGCCWASGVIVWEHRPQGIPVNGAASGSAVRTKATIAYMHDESGVLARRSITFFLVAGLHVVLFYALMSGLAIKIIKVIPTPFQTRILQSPREHVDPPPLPPPQVLLPRSAIPIPDFPVLDAPSEPNDMVRQPPITPPGPQMPSLVERHDIVRAPGGPGIGFPNTDDYYPTISKRMEEQGISTVRVCVDANGRLTSAPTIAQSSGSPRLDGGALTLAKAGSGHYRPATEDGRAVESCYSFRVRFALRTDR